MNRWIDIWTNGHINWLGEEQKGYVIGILGANYNRAKITIIIAINFMNDNQAVLNKNYNEYNKIKTGHKHPLFDIKKLRS